MFVKVGVGKIVKVINKGIINVNGEVIGMVVEDILEGFNDIGVEIVVKDKEDINVKVIGVYVKGVNVKFENKGKIFVENIVFVF